MRWQSVVPGAVLALAVSFLPAVSHAGVLVSITVAPPILPVYVQPVCPEVGFLWTPGYWAYGDAGYFWVPGVWMRPPMVGVLWTPGYWGWHGGLYAWNAGYWGPHVGFYGGVNYGFGYGGLGFAGGRWEGGHFAYNAEVAHVGGGFNSYHEHVTVNNVHTSFNGGAGGLGARPNAGERSAMAEHHTGPTAAQNSHHEMASHDRGNLASANHGRPANAAMSRAHSPSGGASANHGASAKGGGESHGGAKAAEHSAGGSNKGSSGGSKAGSGGSKAGGGPSKPSGGLGNKSGGAGGGSKGGGGKPAASHGGGKK
jgi:hypothetical protein